jgi:hydrogenase/urease accessory protein HupE
MKRRRIARALPFAAMMAVAMIGFSPSALAHVGDHSHLGWADLTDHLFASLDHRLAIMAVGLVLAVVGASVLRTRRKGRERSPEKSAT